MIVRILRFLRAAAPMPSWLVLLTAAVGLYAALTVTLNPRESDEGLALLLLWQMLCASTGFVRQASAGHFDLALVKWPRAAVSLTHALHSVWPVIALWLVIAAIEAVRTDRAPLALEHGRVAALLFVSATAWAIALPAARLVTGSLWLALIVAAATTRVGAEQYAAMLSRPDASISQALYAIGLTLVCPFLLLGNHIPPRAATSAALITATAAVMAAAVFYLKRRDFPLESTL